MSISIVSGHFNPFPHIGHIRLFESASRFGDLIVIVNSDQQIIMRGNDIICPENDRIEMVKSIRYVKSAIVSVDSDKTVTKTLSLIRELFPDQAMFFCNGGDRVIGNTSTQEESFCRRNNIILKYDVGGGKIESSTRIREILTQGKILEESR